MTLHPAEKAALDAFRTGPGLPDRSGDDTTDWLVFGIYVALRAGQTLRSAGPVVDRSEVDIKSDGSPVTDIDHEVEETVREALAGFCPDATLVGEEFGGTLPKDGLAVAIDPVDGTWAFVSGTGTAATSLAVFRDGSVNLGIVANPSTGEVGYSTRDGVARLVRLASFGEPDVAHQLPLSGAVPGKVLVNVHPSPRAQNLVHELFRAWAYDRVQMVRSPGGSPAWALLEAAKGRFSYINLWSQRRAEPYDLAAAVLLVRSAGGEVIDLDGNPIDSVRHSGPFIASIHPHGREVVLEIARAASVGG
jgi:myo-inositol-1(or 4)-monophosphatase